MNAPGLLPDGGVPLPPNYYDLPPLDPKHKAVILYFYYMTAEVAVALNTNEDDEHALQYCSHFAISVFMEKVYGVKIHPDAIPSYYREVRGNVEKAGIPWDVYAVADIISRQVTDENTFNEITSFVTKVQEPLTRSERFFLDKAYEATRCKDGSWIPHVMVDSYWKGASKSHTRDPPKYSDPELPQSHSTDPKTGIYYGGLQKLEHDLAEAKRYRRRDTKRLKFED